MGLWTRLKGRVAKPYAGAAGDRRAEAKNELEAQTGDKPEAGVLDVVEQAERRKHRDIPG
jgi:hypothetical protein